MNEQLFKEHESSANSGYYAYHLSEISKKGNSAYTTSDIINSNGALIAPKGVEICSDIRNKILKHKLTKPLDSSVGLENQANTETLIKEFRNLMDKYPDMAQVNDAMEFGPKFEKLLKVERLHPIITQKLTVLELQMRSEFEKSIFCAWMATMIACEIGMSMDEVRDTLVAAFIHDVGLMHIDPGIVCSNRKLTKEEWDMVSAHVIIGKIIADSIPGLPTEVSRAVIEHHEDNFGSGYPFAICGDELGLPGQIINMTDSIYSIRTKNFANTNRTLGDIKPYLQLNPTTNGIEVYRAIMSIIKKACLKMTKYLPEYCPTKYAKLLGQKVIILEETKESLDLIHYEFTELADKLESDKQFSTIKAIINRIRSSIYESGLFSQELAQWLHIERHPEQIDDLVISEFNEIELLIKELSWQTRNSIRMFQSHHDPRSHDGIISDHIAKSIESLKEGFERLDQIRI